MKSLRLAAVVVAFTLSHAAASEPGPDPQLTWDQLQDRAIERATAALLAGDIGAAITRVEGHSYLLGAAWRAAMESAAEGDDPAALLRLCDGYLDHAFILREAGRLDLGTVLRHRAAAVVFTSDDMAERATAIAWLEYTHARDNGPAGKDKPLLEKLRAAHPRSDYLASVRIAEALVIEDADAQRRALQALSADETLSPRALSLIEVELFESASSVGDWSAAYEAALRFARRDGPVAVKCAALWRAATAASNSSDPAIGARVPQLLRECIQLYPDTSEAASARTALVRHLVWHNRVPEAVAAMDWIEGVSPEGADLSKPLAELADRYRRDGDPALAQRTYLAIFERYGSVNAMVELGGFASAAGRHEEAIEWWEKAAAAKPEGNTLRYDDDAASAVGVAQSSLAQLHMDRGEWAKAARWWKAWTPHHWCGTCLESIESRKPRMIARCLLEGEMHEELLAMLEPAVWSHERRDGFVGAMDLYLEFHRRRGKIDELKARAETVGRAGVDGERAVGVAETILMRIDFDPIIERGNPTDVWRAYLPIQKLADEFETHERYGHAASVAHYLQSAMRELGEPMLAYLLERAETDDVDADAALDVLCGLAPERAFPQIRRRLDTVVDPRDSAAQWVSRLAVSDGHRDALPLLFSYVDDPTHPLHAVAKDFVTNADIERPGTR